MAVTGQDRTTVEEILRNSRTIAVVGLSDKIDRPSFGVAEYLHKFYKIVPVNPQIRSWQGIPAYPDLKSVPKDIQIDAIDIFRPSDKVPPLVEEAIARGVKYVWMQQGIAHQPSADKARKAGLKVVMDSCIAVERAKLA
jgi:predicted CoA-binding protein